MKSTLNKLQIEWPVKNKIFWKIINCYLLAKMYILTQLLSQYPRLLKSLTSIIQLTPWIISSLIGLNLLFSSISDKTSCCIFICLYQRWVLSKLSSTMHINISKYEIQMTIFLNFLYNSYYMVNNICHSLLIYQTVKTFKNLTKMQFK